MTTSYFLVSWSLWGELEGEDGGEAAKTMLCFGGDFAAVSQDDPYNGLSTAEVSNTSLSSTSSTSASFDTPTLSLTST